MDWWVQRRSSLLGYFDFDALKSTSGNKGQFTNYGSKGQIANAEKCTLTQGRIGTAVSLNGNDSFILTGVPWRLAATVSLWLRIRDTSQPFFLLDQGENS